MPCFDSVKKVFEVAQTGSPQWGMLFEALDKISDDCSTPEEFFQDFIHYVKYCMIIFNKEPAVERMIDFVAIYATRHASDESEKQSNLSLTEDSDEDSVPMNTFLSSLLNFLLCVQNAAEKAVRYRSCQLIGKILANMEEDAKISEELAEKILTTMMGRIFDKIPAVRTQAVGSLSRLQDPIDLQCPVVSSFIYLMSSDTNADVRKTVLLNVALTTQTLSPVIERTRDTKDSVRKLAFYVLSEKVGIRALTIAQRIKLLHDGLNDRVESVRKTCYSKLVLSWLKACQGNIIDLLGMLDVQNSVNTVEAVLRELLKGTEDADLLAHVKALKDSIENGYGGNTIPLEKLDCERALYWRCLAEHSANLGSKGQDSMDALLPEISAFCEYIQRYVDGYLTVSEVTTKFHQVFIMQQLLIIAGLMDFSDEVGRKNLSKLIDGMMVNPQCPDCLISALHEIYVSIEPNADIRIKQLTEVISDIKEPITVIETPQIKDANRLRDVKMAGIRVKLNLLRDELEGYVATQDYEKAAEIKSKITEVEQDRSVLEKEKNAENNSQRIEKDDPGTLVRCLSIAGEMLQEINRSGLNPTLITLVETLILPGVQNEDPLVRNTAVKCLGLCSLLSREFAQTHLVLFIQIALLDVEQVQITALKSIFDLLLTFGLEAFKVTSAEQAFVDAEESLLKNNEVEGHDVGENHENDGECDQEEPEIESNNVVETAEKSVSSVFSVLIKLLDRENSEIRNVAAEGLAKLLLSGRVRSPTLLSRLLLLWYNPTTEDDVYLRHCLGAFLPAFAFGCRANHELVEEIFLPTLRTLFVAPNSSPLACVDVSNVADLLVQLTSEKHVKTNQTTAGQNEGNSVVVECLHGSLALKIANEILSNTEGPGVRVLCKTLTHLSLQTANKSNLKDLLLLCPAMLQDIKDKNSKKYLNKFQQSLISVTAEEATEGTEPDQSAVPTEIDSGETQQT